MRRIYNQRLPFQRVTDAWSLKFVRQRENCESQTPRTFSFGVTLYPSNTNKNHIVYMCMPHWVIRPIIYYAVRAALVAVWRSRVTVWTLLSTYNTSCVAVLCSLCDIICYLQKDIRRRSSCMGQHLAYLLWLTVCHVCYDHMATSS